MRLLRAGPARLWIRFRCARLRREKARAGSKNPTIGPVLFAEENFTLAGIAVIPAGDEPKMLGEIAARCRGARFEMFAEDVLCRPRLAGNFGEAEGKRLGQPSAVHAKDADGLPFRGTLQNHGVKILNAAGEFRPAPQDFVGVLPFFFPSFGPFQIQFLPRFLPLPPPLRTP